MSKKKDFKGLTGKILGNNIHSLDDFLGPGNAHARKTDDETPISQSPSEPPLTSDETVSRPVFDSQSNADRNVQQLKSKPAEPEKTRISLYLGMRTVYELDALKTDMRRMSSRLDMSKISKSSIVESAIDIVSQDFKKNGLECALAKMILK